MDTTLTMVAVDRIPVIVACMMTADRVPATVVSTETTGQAPVILACMMTGLVPVVPVCMMIGLTLVIPVCMMTGLALATEASTTRADLVLAMVATEEPTLGTWDEHCQVHFSFLGRIVIGDFAKVIDVFKKSFNPQFFFFPSVVEFCQPLIVQPPYAIALYILPPI